MKKISGSFISLILLPLAFYAQDHDLQKVIKTGNVNKSLKIIADNNNLANEVITLIKNIDYDTVAYGKQKYREKCKDGIDRTLHVYVPEKYNPEKKNSVLIYLHGGVIFNEPGEDMDITISNSKFKALSDEMGFIFVYPVGDKAATWWSDPGLTNLHDQLKLLRNIYNIDDNKIFVGGFSDGGSGTHYLATVKTDVFAGFFPLCGHPAVGMGETKKNVYIRNLYNTSMRISNTDDDEFYPAEKITPLVNALLKSKGDILYNVYKGHGHTFGYSNEELPIITKLFTESIRNPHPDSIVWEAAHPEFGKYCWVSIDKVNPKNKKEWHDDINHIIIDDKIRLGFAVDRFHTGNGIRIVRKSESSPFCNQFGLEEKDVLLKVDNLDIVSYEQLDEHINSADKTKKVKLVFLRDTNKLVRSKLLPEIKPIPYYYRNLPSGLVKAHYKNNTFNISASGVKKLSVYINPQYVDIDKEVKIIVNGKTLHNEIIDPNIKYLLENYFENLDKEQLYIKKLTLKI